MKDNSGLTTKNPIMRKYLAIIYTLLLTISISGCSSEDPIEAQQISGVFMNMEPTKGPVLLSLELISSSLDEYNGTFSPDGKFFFEQSNGYEVFC